MLFIEPVLCYSSAMVDGLLSITDELRFQEILQQKDRCIVALEGELLTLKEQLAWLKKQIFGAKSERIIADLDTQPFLDLDFGSPNPRRNRRRKRSVTPGVKPLKIVAATRSPFPTIFRLGALIWISLRKTKSVRRRESLWSASGAKPAGNWDAPRNSSLSSNTFAPSTPPRRPPTLA